MITKLTERINAKAAIVFAAILIMLLTLSPDVALAGRPRGSTWPSTYGFQLTLNTSPCEINYEGNPDNLLFASGNNPNAIENFWIFDGDVNRNFFLRGTYARQRDLSITGADFELAQDEFNSENFTLPGVFNLIDNDRFFRYSFTFPRDEAGNRPGRLTWFVPNKFSYTDGTNEFSINLLEGESLPVGTLSGLEKIFKIASEAGVERIGFPTIGSSASVSQSITFSNLEG